MREITDRLQVTLPEDALEYGFVDGLIYEDQMKEVFAELGVADDGEGNYEFVSLGDYASMVGPDLDNLGADRVAVVYADGQIVDGEGYGEEIYGNTLAAKLADESFGRLCDAAAQLSWDDNVLQAALFPDSQNRPRNFQIVTALKEFAAGTRYVTDVVLLCNHDSSAYSSGGDVGWLSELPAAADFSARTLGSAGSADATLVYTDAGTLCLRYPFIPCSYGHVGELLLYLDADALFSSLCSGGGAAERLCRGRPAALLRRGHLPHQADGTAGRTEAGLCLSARRRRVQHDRGGGRRMRQAAARRAFRSHTPGAGQAVQRGSRRPL